MHVSTVPQISEGRVKGAPLFPAQPWRTSLFFWASNCPVLFSLLYISAPFYPFSQTTHLHCWLSHQEENISNSAPLVCLRLFVFPFCSFFLKYLTSSPFTASLPVICSSLIVPLSPEKALKLLANTSSCYMSLSKTGERDPIETPACFTVLYASSWQFFFHSDMYASICSVDFRSSFNQNMIFPWAYKHMQKQVWSTYHCQLALPLTQLPIFLCLLI